VSLARKLASIGEIMKYSRPLKIAGWLFVGMLLLQLCNNVMAYAGDGPSKREEMRKIIPVDKMKINLEKPINEQKKQPERVLDVFGVKKGETVADVGAGTGLFSFRAAARVGIEGKVYAVEIEDELLDSIREKIRKDKVTNVIPIKSSDSSPNLLPASCDKIIVAGSYFYFSDTATFMQNMRKALKPGGLIAIIDRDAAKYKVKKRSASPKMSGFTSEVVANMDHAGFVLRDSHDFLEDRFFLIFSAKE
jgi:cyclopropane fatty-acyl-phospholipid synthase-like methyltransferase